MAFWCQKTGSIIISVCALFPVFMFQCERKQVQEWKMSSSGKPYSLFSYGFQEIIPEGFLLESVPINAMC